MQVTDYAMLQKIGLDFFIIQTERAYNKYYNAFFNIALKSALEVLKDHDHANLVCSELFTSLWQNRDKFQFDNSKSHVGYIRLSAHNKAKIQLKKKNGHREILESSVINDDNEDGMLAEKMFYNSGATAIPDKKKKERTFILDRVAVGTPVFVNSTWHSHSEFVMVKRFDTLIQQDAWKIENIKDIRKPYGKGIVTGEFMDNVIVEFAGMAEELAVEMFPKTSITIIARDTPGGALHLNYMDLNTVDCINVRRTQTVENDNADFIKFDDVKDGLFDKIMSNPTDYHDKIKEIIRGFEDGGLLYEAIILKANYSDLALKYNLGTSGAVKTRVFRAKTRLCEIIESEATIGKLNAGSKYTGKLAYYDGKGRLLYKTNYVNGVLHGAFSSYHPNSASTVQVQANFENGVLHGTYKEYNIESKQIVEGIYVEGMEEGMFIYYENNRIVKKIQWADGEPVLLYEYRNGMKTDCRLMELDEHDHPIALLKFNDILYGRLKKATPGLQIQRLEFQPA